MPEILEAEEARRLIEARALGRRIETVDAPDAWFLKRGLTPRALRAALPPRPFRRDGCACAGADGRVEPRDAGLG